MEMHDAAGEPLTIMLVARACPRNTEYVLCTRNFRTQMQAIIATVFGWMSPPELRQMDRADGIPFPFRTIMTDGVQWHQWGGLPPDVLLFTTRLPREGETIGSLEREGVILSILYGIYCYPEPQTRSGPENTRGDVDEKPRDTRQAG